MHSKESKRASIRLKVRNLNSCVYVCMGIFGASVYIFEYIRLNGIQTSKIAYLISFIGTVGNLFVPILLVVGLYLFADDYINMGKINFLGLVCLGIYFVPCVINGGRENVLYLIIAMTAIVGYAKHLDRGRNKKKKKSLFSKILIAVIAVALVCVIIYVSSYRFTSEHSNFFLNLMDVPETIWKEAELFGAAKNLYANFLYYAVHELPGLEMVLRFYDGPYMFGLYELNTISRRLPSSLGLDYRLVTEAMNREVFSKTGDVVLLEIGWRTMLASLIYDFGKYATPFVCGGLGYLVGRVRKHYKKQQSIEYLVLVAIMCMSMFTTIQLGPFFNFSVYGSFLWWIIIFKSPIAMQKREDRSAYD